MLLGEIAGQLVLLAVESPSGAAGAASAAARGRAAPETGESVVADAVEREREEWIGDPERAFQREVGVVGDACARAVESNVILSRETTVAFAPRKVTGVRRVVLDVAIGELVLAAEELAPPSRNSVPSPAAGRSDAPPRPRPDPIPWWSRNR